jgi:hypothetical protein
MHLDSSSSRWSWCNRVRHTPQSPALPAFLSICLRLQPDTFRSTATCSPIASLSLNHSSPSIPFFLPFPLRRLSRPVLPRLFSPALCGRIASSSSCGPTTDSFTPCSLRAPLTFGRWSTQRPRQEEPLGRRAHWWLVELHQTWSQGSKEVPQAQAPSPAPARPMCC